MSMEEGRRGLLLERVSSRVATVYFSLHSCDPSCLASSSPMRNWPGSSALIWASKGREIRIDIR